MGRSEDSQGRWGSRAAVAEALEDPRNSPQKLLSGRVRITEDNSKRNNCWERKDTERGKHIGQGAGACGYRSLNWEGAPQRGHVPLALQNIILGKKNHFRNKEWARRKKKEHRG